MRFNGTDYIVTEHGRQRIGSGINKIGQEILDFVKTAPVICPFSCLMDSLLEEYDVDRALLEKDVRAFVLVCIGADALVEPGTQKLLGLDLSPTSATLHVSTARLPESRHPNVFSRWARSPS